MWIWLGLTVVPMQATNSSNAGLMSVAGFNHYECHGSLLIWNNGSTALPLSVHILQLPYNNFTVDVYELNDDNMPGVSCPRSAHTLERAARLSKWL